MSYKQAMKHWGNHRKARYFQHCGFAHNVVGYGKHLREVPPDPPKPEFAEILYSEVFDSHAAFIGSEYLGSYKNDEDAASVITEARPHIQIIRRPL